MIDDDFQMRQGFTLGFVILVWRYRYAVFFRSFDWMLVIQEFLVYDWGLDVVIFICVRKVQYINELVVGVSFLSIDGLWEECGFWCFYCLLCVILQCLQGC